MRTWKTELGVALALGVLGALARLLPHAPNATPLVGLALFAAFLFQRSYLALGVPTLALLLGDLWLGPYDYRIAALVQASFFFPLVFRRALRSGPKLWTLAAASLSSSLFLFVVADFGVWAFEDLYPRTWAGLVACYTAAIPFLRSAMLSDLAWTAAFFGGYALFQRALPARLAHSTRGG